MNKELIVRYGFVKYGEENRAMVVDTDPFFCGNGCSHRLSLVIGNIGDIGRF